jgi:hypothetical protein
MVTTAFTMPINSRVWRQIIAPCVAYSFCTLACL